MRRAEIDTNLKQAVAAGVPVEIVDPSTNEVYYLVSTEQFRRIAATQYGEFNPQLAYPLNEAIMSEDDQDDPLLESYQ
jgi:hypothetical protein